jgi:hypothetical protein
LLFSSADDAKRLFNRTMLTFYVLRKNAYETARYNGEPDFSFACASIEKAEVSSGWQSFGS